VVTILVILSLTNVPACATFVTNLAHVKDGSRRHRLAERVRCPRAAARHLRSRAAWASCLPALRPAREVFAGLGQAGAGNARGAARGLRPPVGAGFSDRTLRPSRRKHGLAPRLGDEHSPWREPRWNAERRALPLERRRATLVFAIRGADEGKARRLDDASFGVPLPFIAGSEPKKNFVARVERSETRERHPSGTFLSENRIPLFGIMRAGSEPKRLVARG
jgi:hypothetical protein